MKIKLKNAKKGSKAFSKGIHSHYNDLIWVGLYHKYGDTWFFDKIVLMSISEVEIVNII